MAYKQSMTPIQETMIHLVNWMEHAYTGHCMVLNIDLDTGALALFGTDCSDFRNQFNKIVRGVYNA